MITLQINCTGKTSHELILALEEAQRRIEAGNSSGFDSNDGGSFDFAIAGTEEAESHETA